MKTDGTESDNVEEMGDFPWQPPVASESALNDLLCADVFLYEDLKSQLGIAYEKNGIEYCEINDTEWHDLIKNILIRYNKLLAVEIQKIEYTGFVGEPLIPKATLLKLILST